MRIDDREQLFRTAQEQFWNANFHDAETSFTRLARTDPGNAEYALWLGRTYEREASISNPVMSPKQVAKARTELRRAIALDPKNRGALEELIASYAHDGGNPNDVNEAVEQLRKLDPYAADEAEWALGEQHKAARSAQGVAEAVFMAPANAVGAVMVHRSSRLR